MTTQRTTHEIWKMAKESISPTKPFRPGYMWLHPKMIKAMGRFGWEEAVERETRERHKMLQAWELEQGLEVHSDAECPGSEVFVG